METFSGNPYKEGETGMVEKYARGLTAMLSRAGNNMDNESSKNEKIDQFFSPSLNLNFPSNDSKTDQYSAMNWLSSQRMSLGPQMNSEKSSQYSSQSAKMDSQEFPIPGRPLAGQNDPKDEKVVNIMANSNLNKEIPTMDHATAQMYKGRHPQQLYPGYNMNQYQQMPQTHQMAQNPHMIQSPQMTSAQQGQGMEHNIQKMNQTQQLAQMNKFSQNQRMTPGQNFTQHELQQQYQQQMRHPGQQIAPAQQMNKSPQRSPQVQRQQVQHGSNTHQVPMGPQLSQQQMAQMQQQQQQQQHQQYLNSIAQGSQLNQSAQVGPSPQRSLTQQASQMHHMPQSPQMNQVPQANLNLQRSHSQPVSQLNQMAQSPQMNNPQHMMQRQHSTQPTQQMLAQKQVQPQHPHLNPQADQEIQPDQQKQQEMKKAQELQQQQYRYQMMQMHQMSQGSQGQQASQGIAKQQGFDPAMMQQMGYPPNPKLQQQIAQKQLQQQQQQQQQQDPQQFLNQSTGPQMSPNIHPHSAQQNSQKPQQQQQIQRQLSQSSQPGSQMAESPQLNKAQQEMSQLQQSASDHSKQMAQNPLYAQQSMLFEKQKKQQQDLYQQIQQQQQQQQQQLKKQHLLHQQQQQQQQQTAPQANQQTTQQKEQMQMYQAAQSPQSNANGKQVNEKQLQLLQQQQQQQKQQLGPAQFQQMYQHQMNQNQLIQYQQMQMQQMQQKNQRAYSSQPPKDASPQIHPPQQFPQSLQQKPQGHQYPQQMSIGYHQHMAQGQSPVLGSQQKPLTDQQPQMSPMKQIPHAQHKPSVEHQPQMSPMHHMHQIQQQIHQQMQAQKHQQTPTQSSNVYPFYQDSHPAPHTPQTAQSQQSANILSQQPTPSQFSESLTAQRVESSSIKEANGLKENNTTAKGVSSKKDEVKKIQKQAKKQSQPKQSSKKVEIESELSEKSYVEPPDFNISTSSIIANSMSCPEMIRKLESRKPGPRVYEDISQAINYLYRLEDEDSLAYKLLPSKILTPSIIWYLICSSFFPRDLFATKDAKQVLSEAFEKIRGLAYDFALKLPKTGLRPDITQKHITEFELLLIQSLGQGIKYYSNGIVNNDAAMNSANARAPYLREKQSYTEEDDQWVMETRRYIYDGFKKLQEEKLLPALNYDIMQNLNLLSKIDAEDLIKLYEKELKDISTDNERRQSHLESEMLGALGEEKMIHELSFDAEDIMSDVKLTFPEDEKFIALMERRQNDMRLMSQEGKKSVGQEGTKTAQKCRPTSLEDFICQVCNDGDFTDDNKIVFCSRCNIAVHQKCYGIPVVPEEDWICDVCVNFNKNGKYLRCPLCDKKGGAMKPTSIKADTEMFEYLNPEFHAYLKSYNGSANPRDSGDEASLFFKDIKIDALEKTPFDFEAPGESMLPPTNYEDKLYYDYHKFEDHEFTEDELVDEPKPAIVWAHITCVQFIPELYFEDKANLTNISGFEDIERDRFRYNCDVCKKRRNGAVINCQRGSCKKGFHAECARRAKQYLDIRENNANQLVYYIYCSKHTPLQLRRQLETREKKKKEEIAKFFKAIEKCYISSIQDTQPSFSNTNNNNTIKSLNATTNISMPAEASDTKLMVKKRRSATTPGQSKKEDDTSFMKLVEQYEADSIMDSRSNSTPFQLPDIPINTLMEKEKEVFPNSSLNAVIPSRESSLGQINKKPRKLSTKVQKKKEEKISKALNDPLLPKEPQPPKKLGRPKNNPNAGQKISEPEEMKVTDYPVMPQGMPIYPEAEPPMARKNSEFTIRMVRLDYLQRCAGDTSITLPFDLNYLTSALVVDEVICQDVQVCSCGRPYRGEVLIVCETCRRMYHPQCVGAPPNIDPTNIKWQCRGCNRPKALEKEGRPGMERMLNHAALIGKRPSNTMMEGEPNVGKKINYGLDIDSFL